MIALLLLVGCADDNLDPYDFDGPVAGAVLPDGDGPFSQPVGFVASSRSGAITPLDLKEGRFLTDDSTASFLRTAAIPMGRARLLSDVAVVGDGERVTLWAADDGYGQLLRVPYITGLDATGAPIEQAPFAGAVTFLDLDGSGDAATLDALSIRQGWTTTEDWSIAYDGEAWTATGSRSGTQTEPPVAGEVYHTDNHELEFTINGTATAGDRFTLHTDSGIIEYALAGRVAGLATRGGILYATVASSPAELRLYEGVSGVWLGSWVFPEGAEPGRMAFDTNGTLYVADTALPQVHQLTLQVDRTLVGATDVPLATAAEVIDLAVQEGTLLDGTPFRRLFVAPLALQRVDVYDLDAGLWFDPNPVTPEVVGVVIGAPVTGLGASVGPVWLQQETSWGARERAPTVGVSTADGRFYQLDATTGCYVQDAVGPHGPNSIYDSSSAVVFSDQGPASDESMLEDSTTGYQVVASDCGGVTRYESWTVTYESATLDWRVEGSISGVQVARAHHDQRYLSDEGAVSFTILSGPRPASDGDNFTFPMANGLLGLEGSDQNEDGQVESSWEFPTRPVAFETVNGPTGGGWDPVDLRQYVLLPALNADLVARIWLDAGRTEVAWQ